MEERQLLSVRPCGTSWAACQQHAKTAVVRVAQPQAQSACCASDPWSVSSLLLAPEVLLKQVAGPWMGRRLALVSALGFGLEPAVALEPAQVPPSVLLQERPEAKIRLEQVPFSSSSCSSSFSRAPTTHCAFRPQPRHSRTRARAPSLHHRTRQQIQGRHRHPQEASSLGRVELAVHVVMHAA